MKKCPFCGEQKYIEWQSNEKEDGQEIIYFILCLSCSAQGPPSDSRIGAEELWNNRNK